MLGVPVNAEGCWGLVLVCFRLPLTRITRPCRTQPSKPCAGSSLWRAPRSTGTRFWATRSAKRCRMLRSSVARVTSSIKAVVSHKTFITQQKILSVMELICRSSSHILFHRKFFFFLCVNSGNFICIIPWGISPVGVRPHLLLINHENF